MKTFSIQDEYIYFLTMNVIFYSVWIQYSEFNLKYSNLRDECYLLISMNIILCPVLIQLSPQDEYILSSGWIQLSPHGMNVIVY